MNGRMVLGLLSCLGLTLQAAAQQPAKQASPRQHATQPSAAAATPQTAKPAPAKQKPAKEYKGGETYAVGDVINLDAEGHTLTVRTVPSESNKAALRLNLTIAGNLTFLGFTYGRENSAITLVADGKRIPASRASFTDEVVASGGGGLFAHMVTDSPKGTLVLDNNLHSLLVEFQTPGEISGAARELELKELSLGDNHYSLKVTVQK